MKKPIKPPKESRLKQALLGLYGIIGVSVSTFGGFKVPFAESHAKEYWRHALFGIILVLGLIAGIISFAFYIFDANYFKSQMVDYVKTHNQRDLTLDGDIRITFFPRLGLDAGKMSLSQRNSSKNFASIDNAHFYIAWWPLVLKQLQIESVALDGVHANIVRYKNGSSSLDDLLSTEGGMGDIKFEIDSIKLSNSSFNLQDETAGLFVSLHDLSLETGKLSDSIPGNVTANFRLESSKPRIDTRVKLNSHFLFELKTGHLAFANFDAQLEGEAAGISNLAMNIQGSVDSYPAMQRFTADKLLANVKGKLENRKLEAKIDLPRLEYSKNKLSGSTLSASASLLQEDENMTAALEIPAFEASEKKLRSENITASFDLFKSGSTLQGKFNSPLNLDFATQQLTLPAIASSMNGSHSLLSGKLTASLSGNMQANFGEQKANLALKAKIDDSNLTGSIALHNFTQPVYTFDLSFNTLDLDRYLAADWSKRLQDDTLPFDFSGLKNLNMRGKLRSNEFKFAKLKISNLYTEIKAEQSSLLLDLLNARLYSGTASGNLNITANDTPKIALRQKLTGVQLNALLADIIPGEAKLGGRGNLTLDLNATGENMGALRKTINGNASFTLMRGSIAGVNFIESLLAGKSQLGMPNNEHRELAKFTESTAFTELKSSFEIENGKARNNDFLMKSPLFTSKGEGEINLDSGQLSYRLNSTVASTLKRGSSGELAELKGVSIPMGITGHYTTPTISMDFANASGGKLAKAVKPGKAKSATTATPGKKKSAVK